MFDHFDNADAMAFGWWMSMCDEEDSTSTCNCPNCGTELEIENPDSDTSYQCCECQYIFNIDLSGE